MIGIFYMPLRQHRVQRIPKESAQKVDPGEENSRPLRVLATEWDRIRTREREVGGGGGAHQL